MSADETGQRRWRRTGCLLYFVGYCLVAGDYPDVGVLMVALSMLCHWQFWR